VLDGLITRVRLKLSLLRRCVTQWDVSVWIVIFCFLCNLVTNEMKNSNKYTVALQIIMITILNNSVFVSVTSKSHTVRSSKAGQSMRTKWQRDRYFSRAAYVHKQLVGLIQLTSGHSLAGVAGSNSDCGVDVCLLRVLCFVRQRSLLRAGHASRGVLPCAVCVSVIVKM
jgi:hypothetical protein